MSKQKHKLKVQDNNCCHNYLWVRDAESEELERFEKAAIDCSPWMTFRGKPHQTLCGPGVHYIFFPTNHHVLKAEYDSIEVFWETEHWAGKKGASLTNDWLKGWREIMNETYPYYWFDTPTKPPIAFLLDVSKALPTVTFVLTYHHEHDCFLGIAKAEAGKIKRYEIQYAEVNNNSKEVSCG